MSDHRRAVTVWSSAVVVSAAAVAGFVHVHWLVVVALVIAVAAFVLLLLSGVTDVVGWAQERLIARRQRRYRPGRVYTDRWEHTTEGMQVPGLMTTLQKRLNHPGYMRGGSDPSPPFVRIGLLMASDQLGDGGCTTSDVRSAFVRLLAEPPISDLVSKITHVTDDLKWRVFDGNGRLNNGAVLTLSDDQSDAPIAAAILNLAQAGTQHFMQDVRVAELVIQIEPRDKAGEPAPPANLTIWFDRLTTALELPAAFATFLSRDVGLQTYNDPPTQLGVRLDAYSGLTELVDITGFTRVAGSGLVNSFPSYVRSARDGKSAREAVLDMLRVWCDHALYVSGYEGELAQLREHA